MQNLWVRLAIGLGILLVILGVVFVFMPSKSVAPSPAPQPTGDSLTTIGLNASTTLNGFTITPIAVEEDSRCPVDVQCIQAGTVRVRANLASSYGKLIAIFTLGTPINTETGSLTLYAVLPDKHAGLTIKPTDYRFTFTTKKSTP